MKEYLFHSTIQVRNGNLLKSRVGKIRIKRICINEGFGVHFIVLETYNFDPKRRTTDLGPYISGIGD